MSFLGLLQKKLLNESASVENVTRAMDNHSKVIINYHTKGKNEHTGTRVIEPVAYGLTKAGNPVIRAYQPYGDTTTKIPGWKFFRLDRISYWEETTSKFDKVPDFNVDELNADGDETMSVVIKTYNSTIKPNGDNAVNSGPKTKEKIFATAGDKQLSLAQRNLERMKNGLRLDVINNKKVGNAFNFYDNNAKSDDSTGPRVTNSNAEDTQINYAQTFGDKQLDLGRRNLERMKTNIQKSAELGRDGSVESGDITPEELENARELVYNNGTTNEHGQDDNSLETYGDKQLSLAQRNLERMKNAKKIDLDNIPRR